jgi:hypothetical protein
MLKSKVTKLGTAFALVFAFASVAIASADLLSIPSMIPDACFFGHCVQFTQTAALANIQHVVGEIQQLKNEATNLATLGTSPASLINAQAEINAVLGTGKNVAATVQADAAAQAITTDSSEDVAETARLNGLATQALGANQQAQVQNGMLSQLVVTQQKSLDLQAAQQNQEAAMRSDISQGLGTLSQPYTGPAPGQGGW